MCWREKQRTSQYLEISDYEKLTGTTKEKEKKYVQINATRCK